MHIPTSMPNEDDYGSETVKDPMIMSRTLGLMRLNSSSSCQSLDRLRDEVFNMSIRRPQVVEDNCQ